MHNFISFIWGKLNEFTHSDIFINTAIFSIGTLAVYGSIVYRKDLYFLFDNTIIIDNIYGNNVDNLMLSKTFFESELRLRTIELLMGGEDSLHFHPMTRYRMGNYYKNFIGFNNVFNGDYDDIVIIITTAGGILTHIVNSSEVGVNTLANYITLRIEIERMIDLYNQKNFISNGRMRAILDRRFNCEFKAMRKDLKEYYQLFDQIYNSHKIKVSRRGYIIEGHCRDINVYTRKNFQFKIKELNLGTTNYESRHGIYEHRRN